MKLLNWQKRDDIDRHLTFQCAASSLVRGDFRAVVDGYNLVNWKALANKWAWNLEYYKWNYNQVASPGCDYDPKEAQKVNSVIWPRRPPRTTTSTPKDDQMVKDQAQTK